MSLTVHGAGPSLNCFLHQAPLDRCGRPLRGLYFSSLGLKSWQERFPYARRERDAKLLQTLINAVTGKVKMARSSLSGNPTSGLGPPAAARAVCQLHAGVHK